VLANVSIGCQIERQDLLVVRVKQGGPELVVALIVRDFLGAMLEPIGQSHIAVGQVNGICPFELRGNRVLLGQYQTHDFTQLDVVDEELHMDRVRRELGRTIGLVLDEIFFVDHFDVRILGNDSNGPAEGHSNRAVSGIQGPPDALPQSFVRAAELRAFDAGIKG
jgi:hypothetical protein